MKHFLVLITFNSLLLGQYEVDSNLVSSISKHGIIDDNIESLFNSIKQSLDNSFSLKFDKLFENYHSGEMDTVMKITSVGYNIYFLKTHNKILLLSITILNHYKNLKYLPTIGKARYQDCINLFNDYHLKKSTYNRIEFSTYDIVESFLEFEFDENKILSKISITYGVD